jgi:hypothetical protein
MSYAIRDDNPTFGSLAAVEHANGAGASTIGCIQSYEPIEFEAQTATTFAANQKNTVFIAPPTPSQSLGLVALGQKYQVLGASVYYSTAGGAGSTLILEICPAGTADGSGNTILAAPFSLATAQSNTPFNLTLNANVDNLTVLPGGRINVNAGATATTGLVNLCVMIYLARIA